MQYIRNFETQLEYEAAKESLLLPNVSACDDEPFEVFYNPAETRLVAKYNVTSTTNPTKIGYNNYINAFEAIEIDGVVQPNVVSAYTFDTLGEHTVKYTLSNPTTTGRYTFSYCYNLKSVIIPDTVKTIGASTFHGCSGLTSVVVPDEVTSMREYAFQGCSSLTSIYIPSGVTKIMASVFSNCKSLTSVTIPSGVTVINDYAFSNCSGLTSIIIPNQVTSVGSNAFYNCKSATSVTIGNSVTSIGDNAFQYCSRLNTIKSLSTTAPTVSSNTFQELPTGGTLTVPNGSNGYNTWMSNEQYYLGYYNWNIVYLN